MVKKVLVTIFALLCVVVMGNTQAETESNSQKKKMSQETKELSPAARKAGFIAQSASRMSWDEAKDFCRRHGGKLPRVNNSDSWSDGKVRALAAGTIDGFGYPMSLWSETGLDGDGTYWTGTEHTGYPGDPWIVDSQRIGTHVGVAAYVRFDEGGRYYAVCVQ